MRANLNFQTKTVHADKTQLPDGNVPLVSPVHHSVKYIPRNMQHLREILEDRHKGYIYSRVVNPTVRELEVLLAELQGRDDAICVSSGIAAISSAALALLKAGDHVLMFTESYKPTRLLMNTVLQPLGIRTSVVSIDEMVAIENIFAKDPPQIVVVESPTNPALRIPDLTWLAKLCRSKNAISILDNTFAGFHHHGKLPIDILVHSLTKHACGHSDAMGGVIITRQDLIEKIFPIAITLGATLDPNAAWLIMRGMKTYALRTREASANAAKVFMWLKDRPEVSNLRYPADPSHKDYQIWQSQMNGDGGTVLTFDLTGDSRALDEFIDHLKIFSLTPSMGCVESLVAPCMLLFGNDLTPAQAKQAGIRDSTVRLAIGVEASEDLIADLEQAFSFINR